MLRSALHGAARGLMGWIVACQLAGTAAATAFDLGYLKALYAGQNVVSYDRQSASLAGRMKRGAATPP